MCGRRLWKQGHTNLGEESVKVFRLGETVLANNNVLHFEKLLGVLSKWWDEMVGGCALGLCWFLLTQTLSSLYSSSVILPFYHLHISHAIHMWARQ
jgi:hypothetical protein